MAKDSNDGSSTGSTNTVAVVVGVCVGAAIIIALIVIIVLLKRKRQDDVPAAVVVVPVDSGGEPEQQISVKAALEQYRGASTRADFVSAIKLLTKAIRNGEGSEVSQVGKRDLTCIAVAFHTQVGDEVWRDLLHLFQALLKEYDERMGNAPPAGTQLARMDPAHQKYAAEGKMF